MKHKSEVLEKFKEFEAVTTNESARRIVKLRTDNGGEYLSQEFKTHLKSKGIQHELTVPCTFTTAKWSCGAYEQNAD